MTPENYFKDLASKLELTKAESDRISQKHNFLREKLCEMLPVEDDFLTGSYARNTMIRPNGDDKFDIDFFLAFNKEDYGESELLVLLRLVKNALEKIKNDDRDILEIQEQKRSIGVIYNDNFQIDVVPAIQIEKNKCYKIFDKKTQRAVESNPKLHGSILTSANDATESGGIKRLVPIIKLLKYWRRSKCNYVKSFHLQILAVKILENEEIDSFSQGVEKFFSNVKNYLQLAGLEDPANVHNIIDEYLDEDGNRDELLSLISSEAEKAEKAINFEKNGENGSAVNEWKKIFENDENGADEKKTATSQVYINRVPPKPHVNV